MTETLKSLALKKRVQRAMKLLNLFPKSLNFQLSHCQRTINFMVSSKIKNLRQKNFF